MTTSHYECRLLWKRNGTAAGRLLYVPKHDVLIAALDVIHPGNLGPLPPAPWRVAYQAELAGIAHREEFFWWR